MIELFRRVDRAWARGEEWLTVTVLDLDGARGRLSGRHPQPDSLRHPVGEQPADGHGVGRLVPAQRHAVARVPRCVAWRRTSTSTSPSTCCCASRRARSKYWMLAISGMLAGLITFGLTFSFWKAVELNLHRAPSRIRDARRQGSDARVRRDRAAARRAAGHGASRRSSAPSRSVLGVFGIPAETPGAAFQLIVPIVFLVIAFRLFAYGIGVRRRRDRR